MTARGALFRAAIFFCLRVGIIVSQIESARNGIITPEAARVAEAEGLRPERVQEEVAAGKIVIPANRLHVTAGLEAVGIGRSLRTKVNANIGTSPECTDVEAEIRKLHTALKAGADTLMDLSTGGDLDEIRVRLLASCPLPFGTVPVYQAAFARSVEDINSRAIMEVIEKQASQGVDFFTIHAGILREHLPLLQNRVAGVVSRGGALLAKWMLYHQKQNPFYEMFDEIAAVMAGYDVCFSLGDGLRPGAVADSTDEAQLAELRVLGELVERAREHGCQVMVEGPGHVPFNEIQHNMELQQTVCDGAPFYVLGPIVTDAAAGYDHITSAIGGTAAAYYGASFLCYVTPAEHLGLPDCEDVRLGVMASRVAAHAADVARGLKAAVETDKAVSIARSTLDWERQIESCLDPAAARRVHERTGPKPGSLPSPDYCSMCGKEWCSLRINREIRQALQRQTRRAAHS